MIARLQIPTVYKYSLHQVAMRLATFHKRQFAIGDTVRMLNEFHAVARPYQLEFESYTQQGKPIVIVRIQGVGIGMFVQTILNHGEYLASQPYQGTRA